MSKVYVENTAVAVPDADREAISNYLAAKAEGKGPGSIAGDQDVTVNGTTYSGTVLVAGARETITFQIRGKADATPKKQKDAGEAPAKNAVAKKAAPKKAAAKKAAPKKAAAKKAAPKKAAAAK